MKRKATMLLTTMLAVGLTAGQALSATVCGFAQNAQGPVAGVVVEVKDASGKVLGTATTGSNGQYSISGLSPGTLDLFIDPSTGVLGGSGVLDLTGDSRMVNWQVSDSTGAVASQDGVCRAGALTPIEWASIGALAFLGAGGAAVLGLGWANYFDSSSNNSPSE